MPARRLPVQADDFRAKLWHDLMRSGRLEEAWRVSDAILAARRPEEFNQAGVPYHLRPVWRGAPLDGRRVLVRCYHGLGDTVQFARYVPILARCCPAVFVEAQPALVPLLCSLEGIATAVGLGMGDHLPAEIDIESMELPHAFRTPLEAIPAEVPYLRPAGAADRIAAPELQVGLCWRGGGWDRRRAVKLEDLEPLLGIDGVRFHGLQLDAAQEMRRWPQIHNSADPDILQMASSLSRFDLVISIDTFLAHLVGALAIPGWVLLHADADWRWLARGSRSAWYPTLRLFRQNRPGDWRAPIRAVAARLTHAVRAGRAGSQRSASSRS